MLLLSNSNLRIEFDVRMLLFFRNMEHVLFPRRRNVIDIKRFHQRELAFIHELPLVGFHPSEHGRERLECEVSNAGQFDLVQDVRELSWEEKFKEETVLYRFLFLQVQLLKSDD